MTRPMVKRPAETRCGRGSIGRCGARCASLERNGLMFETGGSPSYSTRSILVRSNPVA